MKDFDKDFFFFFYKKYPMEGHNDWLFEDLPKSAQFGLIQEFADTKGYDILTYMYEKDMYIYEVNDFNDEEVGFNTTEAGEEYGTRQEARDKAIEKLKELYNQKE